MELTNYLVSVGMSMSQVFTHQAVGIAITNKLLESQEAQSAALLNDIMPMPQTTQGPLFGRLVDAYA